jgi:hypothetical protein
MEELIGKAYNKITVPKFLIIENKRLGFSLRVLQLTAFCIVIYLIYGLAQYEADAALSPYSTEIFLTQVYDAPPDSVPHCDNLDNYDGTTTPSNKKPQACKYIPAGETVEKTNDGLYVSTYNQDVYVTQGTYDEGTYDEVEYAFFTPNPELRHLKLVHGYKVQIDEAGTTLFGRSTETEVTQRAPDGETSTITGKTMVTEILTYDNKPCTVGGKDTWTQADAEDGIGGSIKDWLLCAGLNLDDHASAVDSNKKVVNRLTGADVYFDLVTTGPYNRPRTGPGPGEKDYGDDVIMVTKLRVSAKAQYSTRNSVAYTRMHRPDAGSGKYRSRTSRGLAFHVSTRGAYKFPSYAKLVTAIVNSLVILTLPNKIMMAVAMFALSLISEIYRDCARERLNISNQFFGVVARYMAHVENFRYVTKQKKVGLDHMKGMDYALLRKTMRAVFEEDIYNEKTNPNGALEEDEFTQLTRIMMFHLDKDGNKVNTEKIKEAKKRKSVADVMVEDGDIGMDEYIAASASNEVVAAKQIVKFFDDERKKSFMEKIFDDTVIEAPRKQAATVKKGASAFDFMMQS